MTTPGEHPSPEIQALVEDYGSECFLDGSVRVEFEADASTLSSKAALLAALGALKEDAERWRSLAPTLPEPVDPLKAAIDRIVAAAVRFHVSRQTASWDSESMMNAANVLSDAVRAAAVLEGPSTLPELPEEQKDSKRWAFVRDSYGLGRIRQRPHSFRWDEEKADWGFVHRHNDPCDVPTWYPGMTFEEFIDAALADASTPLERNA